MSLSPDNMMKLMAFADGELESADREEVLQLIGTNDDAVRFVEDVGGLGDFVKVVDATRDGKTVAAFDIADQVMAAAIAEGASRGLELAPVRSLAEARVKENQGTRHKQGGSRRSIGIAAVATALALAASVVFLARPKEVPLSAGPVARVDQGEKVALRVMGDPISPNGGVEVEKPGSSVSVFYLPGQNEISTSVVVWVDETAEK